MKYLHRTMLVVFTLGIFFGFSNDAWSKSRHRHHRTHTVVKIKEVIKYVTVTPEKDEFPVINVAVPAFLELNISSLLADVHSFRPVVVADHSWDPADHNAIDATLDNEELQARLLSIIGYMGLSIGLSLLSLCIWVEHASFLRLHSRSAWTRASEMVTRAYRGWQASCYDGKVRDFARRFREPSYRESDAHLPTSGGELIMVLLKKLPKKYVSRIDIPS